MRQAEPAIGGVEAQGTAFNPQSGKTATTAMLQAKSSDALTNYELENLESLPEGNRGERNSKSIANWPTAPFKFRIAHSTCEPKP
jgi:hypothetical protein